MCIIENCQVTPGGWWKQLVLIYHLYLVFPHGLNMEIITIKKIRTVCTIVIIRCMDISTS